MTSRTIAIWIVMNESGEYEVAISAQSNAPVWTPSTCDESLRNTRPITMLLHTAHLSMSLIQIDLAVDFVVLRGLPGDCGRGRRDISRLRIAMLNA